MNELKNAQAAAEHRVQVEKDNANDAKAKLDGKSVKIVAKAGQGGKLFGSVTSKEIAEAIRAQYQVTIDKRRIESADIKAFGTFTCEIKLYTGISAKIYVVVGEE